MQDLPNWSLNVLKQSTLARAFVSSFEGGGGERGCGQWDGYFTADGWLFIILKSNISILRLQTESFVPFSSI